MSRIKQDKINMYILLHRPQVFHRNMVWVASNQNGNKYALLGCDPTENSTFLKQHIYHIQLRENFWGGMQIKNS